MKRIILFALLLVVVTGGVAAAGGGISLGSDTLTVGENTTATHVVESPNGTTDVTDESTWTSTNPDVATVDGGTVNTHSTGSATLVAEYSDENQTYTNTASLDVDQSDLSLPYLFLIAGSILFIIFATPRSIGGLSVLGVQIFVSGGYWIGAVDQSLLVASSIMMCILAMVVATR